jgi:ribosomal protein S18 acetylase RimI-like enzyme
MIEITKKYLKGIFISIIVEGYQEMTSERELLDLNEYSFYKYMPDSQVVHNKLGFFIKNRSIETYSYVVPTEYGDENFEDFINFTHSHFTSGKEYYIVKVYDNDYFLKNSKILRNKKLIQYHLDTSIMTWEGSGKDELVPHSYLEIDLLSSKKVNRWINVFFDSFSYPPHLKKYITSMVKNQIEQGIEFFVGMVSGKDVCCFCSFEDDNYLGIYGVGTKQKYRRRGYAKTMMSNYIEDKNQLSPQLKFCLQAQKNSGAEILYKGIGFESPYIQKRFDWDPSTSSILF